MSDKEEKKKPKIKLPKAGQMYPGPLTEGRIGHVAMASDNHSERRLAFEVGVEAFCKAAGFDADDTAAMKSILVKISENPMPFNAEENAAESQGSFWTRLNESMFNPDNGDAKRTRSGNTWGDFVPHILGGKGKGTLDSLQDAWVGNNAPRAGRLQTADTINKLNREGKPVPPELEDKMTPDQRATADAQEERQYEQMQAKVKRDYAKALKRNNGNEDLTRRDILTGPGGRKALMMLDYNPQATTPSTSGQPSSTPSTSGQPSSTPPMPQPTQNAANVPPSPDPTPTPTPDQGGGLSGQGATAPGKMEGTPYTHSEGSSKTPDAAMPDSERMAQPTQSSTPEPTYAPYTHSEMGGSSTPGMPKPTQASANTPPAPRTPSYGSNKPDVAGPGGQAIKGLKGWSASPVPGG